jgi:hypothetical protein
MSSSFSDLLQNLQVDRQSATTHVLRLLAVEARDRDAIIGRRNGVLVQSHRFEGGATETSGVREAMSNVKWQMSKGKWNGGALAPFAI